MPLQRNAKPASMSIPIDKMPVSVAIQALAKDGIQAKPEDFQQHQKDQLNDAVAKKVIPDAMKNQ